MRGSAGRPGNNNIRQCEALERGGLNSTPRFDVPMVGWADRVGKSVGPLGVRKCRNDVDIRTIRTFAAGPPNTRCANLGATRQAEKNKMKGAMR